MSHDLCLGTLYAGRVYYFYSEAVPFSPIEMMKKKKEEKKMPMHVYSSAFIYSKKGKSKEREKSFSFSSASYGYSIVVPSIVGIAYGGADFIFLWPSIRPGCSSS